MDGERKYKHLEFIQGVINRLSANSFLLKGWSITLISALLALSAEDSRCYLVFLAYIPAIMFWVLDGFFLWQEQLYRNLYDHVRVLKDNDIDFSMDTAPFKSGDAPTWTGAIRSKTLVLLHGILVFAITIVVILTIIAKD